ncbi:MAG TPA: DUF2442 domain-containing protein [Verrucomicrobiae bacterium]|nr:DUF2442 domain-containing protein [Verrucomicrobiae bacterium]
MNTDIEYIPYGEISSSLTKHRWRTLSQKTLVSGSWQRNKQAPRRVFVSFSKDLDDTFVEMFREKATDDTRLLIFNPGFSTDRLVSRIVDLQIRTPQRFCVIDTEFGSRKARYVAFVQSLLKRLTSAFEADDRKERILDAKIEDGILHVVSLDFDRLDVPIADIPNLGNAVSSKIQEFKIDDDGSFIYWPALDLHLGWVQLQQLINPAAALKAFQRSEEFNKRYGKAVQKVREMAGLRPSDISGISEKQLRRIENGECRLTTNAIEALSQAHKLGPNEYMKKLAEAFEDPLKSPATTPCKKMR